MPDRCGPAALIAGLAPELRALAAPLLEQQLGGEFAAMVALLPAAMADLLPVPAATARGLGAALSCGWLFTAAQDELLDGGQPPAAALVGHLALLRAVELFRQLGLAGTPVWPELERRAALAAAAYARELAARPEAPAAALAWTPALIVERAALLGFAPLAQAALAGLAPADPRRAAAGAALEGLVLARQIGDDAADWAADLASGRLNYVSAAMARSLAADPARPDWERVAGRQAFAEGFWSAIEAEHAAACQGALAALAPFGPCGLADLIAQEQARSAGRWADLRAARAAARGLAGAGR